MVGESNSDEVNLDFSVPQGSIFGPVLYTVYASTILSCIEDFQVSILGYADDHSVYDVFDPKSSLSRTNTISNLETCLVSINDWMNMNRLKMNTSKTEFILIGSRVHLQKCTTQEHIVVCDESVKRVASVKYLGVRIDDQLTLKIHIQEKCRTASANLYCIRQIRSCLTKELCQRLVQSLVLSHFDYANALYYGLPATTLAPMQRLLHQAAKLILKRRKYDSASDALRTLHWLPIAYRSKFKIACLVYRSLDGTAPAYLRDLLTIRAHGRNTRSNTDAGIQLCYPVTKRKTFADRSFSIAGPKIWNEIPCDIRLSIYFKTWYFQCAYIQN